MLRGAGGVAGGMFSVRVPGVTGFIYEMWNDRNRCLCHGKSSVYITLSVLCSILNGPIVAT